MEEELTCSICLDLFKEPVTLLCSHSFCRECLNQVAESANLTNGYKLPTCPTCRGNVSRRQFSQLKENKVLSNIVAAYKKENENVGPVPSMVCVKHPTEQLRLYCQTCKQPICCDCATETHHYSQCDVTYVEHLIHAKEESIKRHVKVVEATLAEKRSAISEKKSLISKQKESAGSLCNFIIKMLEGQLRETKTDYRQKCDEVIDRLTAAEKFLETQATHFKRFLASSEVDKRCPDRQLHYLTLSNHERALLFHTSLMPLEADSLNEQPMPPPFTINNFDVLKYWIKKISEYEMEQDQVHETGNATVLNSVSHLIESSREKRAAESSSSLQISSSQSAAAAVCATKSDSLIATPRDQASAVPSTLADLVGRLTLLNGDSGFSHSDAVQSETVPANLSANQRTVGSPGARALPSVLAGSSVSAEDKQMAVSSRTIDKIVDSVSQSGASVISVPSGVSAFSDASISGVSIQSSTVGTMSSLLVNQASMGNMSVSSAFAVGTSVASLLPKSALPIGGSRMSKTGFLSSFFTTRNSSRAPIMSTSTSSAVLSVSPGDSSVPKPAQSLTGITPSTTGSSFNSGIRDHSKPDVVTTSTVSAVTPCSAAGASLDSSICNITLPSASFPFSTTSGSYVSLSTTSPSKSAVTSTSVTTARDSSLSAFGMSLDFSEPRQPASSAKVPLSTAGLQLNFSSNVTSSQSGAGWKTPVVISRFTSDKSTACDFPKSALARDFPKSAPLAPDVHKAAALAQNVPKSALHCTDKTYCVTAIAKPASYPPASVRPKTTIPDLPTSALQTSVRFGAFQPSSSSASSAGSASFQVHAPTFTIGASGDDVERTVGKRHSKDRRKF